MFTYIVTVIRSEPLYVHYFTVKGSIKEHLGWPLNGVRRIGVNTDNKVAYLGHLESYIAHL